MKSYLFALIVGLGILTVRVGFSEESPTDAFGLCYHFYNCQGITFPGGYVSADDCRAEGGLSVQEGSYCENLANDSDADVDLSEPVSYSQSR